MRSLLFVSVLIFLFLKGVSQNKLDKTQSKHEDSLTIYSTNINDSLSLNKLINYCFRYKNEIPDLAFKYSELSYESSKKNGFKNCEARSITNLGAVEVQRGNYAAALKYYMNGLAIWEKLNYQKGIMFNKNNIAQVYGNINKPELEFRFLTEAAKIAEENNYEDGIALVNDNLSIYYYLQNDFRTAFKYATKAIAVNLKIAKLSDACRCYSNAGDMLSRINLEDSAIIYFNYAKEIATKINDNYVLALCYANLASTYHRKNEIEKAIEFHQKSILLNKQIGGKDNLLIEYKELSSIYKEQGKFEQALLYSLLAQEMKDTIMNQSNLKSIAELQTKYDTEKKDLEISNNKKEIELHQKQRVIQNIIIISLCLLGLLVSAFVFIRLKNKKQKQDYILQSERAIKEEQNKKAILEAAERERTRIAQDLHDNMGAYATSILAQIDMLETSSNELKNEKIHELRSDAEHIMSTLRETIWILKNKTISAKQLFDLLRLYADKHLVKNLSIHVVYSEDVLLDKLLSPTVSLNLYRILQEIIQNVIKHASATQVEIKLASNQKISLEISDNGVGFDYANLQRKSGLENMEHRANEIKYQIDVISATGTGTFFKILEV